MAFVENLVTAALTILSLALFLVSLRAWLHTRSVKVLFLATAFALFLAKGLLLSLGLFQWPDWERRLFVPLLVLDLAILATLYLAVLKRSGA